MEEISKSYILELLFKNTLFQGLSRQEIETIEHRAERKQLAPGEYLMREGEASDRIFIILSGELEVLKYNPEIQENFVLDQLGANDTVGEISFLDHGPRTATVKAKTPCQLLSLSIDNIRGIMKTSDRFQEIFLRLSEKICSRLRKTNELVVTALKKESEGYKARAQLGVMLIYMTACFSLFLYFMPALKYLKTVTGTNTFSALLITVCSLILSIFVVRVSKASWQDLGVNLNHWKQSVWEGGVLSFFLILAGVVIVKEILIAYHPDFSGRKLVEPFVGIQSGGETNWRLWIFINSVYVFLMVPIQEFLARGIFQGLLEKVLVGKLRVFSAIVVSNLVFGALHILLSTEIAIIVFVCNCYLGFLYSRTHSLLTSYLAHVYMGVLGFSVFGILRNLTQ